MPRDIDACLVFANALVKEKRRTPDMGVTSFEKRMTRQEEMKFVKSTARGVSEGNTASVATFHGQRMIGNAAIARRKTKDEHHSGVFGIAILDGYRGVGIGERMMREAFQEARALGIWLIELSVFAVNKPAIHLYEKMGFRTAGVIPDKVIRGERHYDEITMYADLRGSDKSPRARRGKS
jgi:ribosomal protein S18 acetylase RimI-like enzyme